VRIIVCIKQVPDTSAEVVMDKERGTLVREKMPAVINPFDTYAIEEAIRLKERLGDDVHTIGISMGPPQAEDALREAIAMGLDEAVLLSSRDFAGADTLATSKTLAWGIKKLGFDLILCGKQASDGDTAQVGPGIAEWLDIPQVTFIRKIVEIDDKHAVVERMTETGYEVLETPLPALLTVVKEINEPRLPSLRGKLRAKKIEIPVYGPKELGLNPDEVGLKGSPTQVIKIFTPEIKRHGEIVHGEPEELAQKFVEFIKSRQLLLK